MATITRTMTADEIEELAKQDMAEIVECAGIEWARHEWDGPHCDPSYNTGMSGYGMSVWHSDSGGDWGWEAKITSPVVRTPGGQLAVRRIRGDLDGPLSGRADTDADAMADCSEAVAWAIERTNAARRALLSVAGTVLGNDRTDDGLAILGLLRAAAWSETEQYHAKDPDAEKRHDYPTRATNLNRLVFWAVQTAQNIDDPAASSQRLIEASPMEQAFILNDAAKLLEDEAE